MNGQQTAFQAVVARIVSIFMMQQFGSGRQTTGTEIEFLVVSGNDRKAYDGGCERLLYALLRGGYMTTPIMDDDNDMRLDGVELMLLIQEGFYTVTVTTDAGRNQGEVILPPIEDLNVINELEATTFGILETLAAENGDLLVDIGHHPFGDSPSAELWVERARYEMIIQGVHELALKHGGDPTAGGNVHWTVYTASQQATVGARNVEHQLRTMRAYAELSGLVVALCGNCPGSEGEMTPANLARRNRTWNSFPDATRIGIPPRFADVTEFAQFIADMDTFIGPGTDSSKYAVVSPPQPFWEYAGDLDDDAFLTALKLLIGCTWWEARMRLTEHGTVEGRTPCHQPKGERGVVSALYVGLARNVDQALELCDRFTLDEWRVARIECAQHGMQGTVADTPVTDLIGEMLDIAQAGLEDRALGEAHLLGPLYARLESGMNPAQRRIADVGDDQHALMTSLTPQGQQTTSTAGTLRAAAM